MEACSVLLPTGWTPLAAPANGAVVRVARFFEPLERQGGSTGQPFRSQRQFKSAA
jgi:hypothetical protein